MFYNKKGTRNVLTSYNKNSYSYVCMEWDMSINSIMDETKNITFKEYYIEKGLIESKECDEMNGLIRCRSLKKNKYKNDIFILPQLAHLTGLPFQIETDWKSMKIVEQQIYLKVKSIDIHYISFT